MQRLTTLSAALLVSTLALPVARAAAPSNPAASTAATTQAGEQVFTHNCAQCHSVMQGQYSFGPNLYHETRKTPRKSPSQLRAIIQNGKGKMPPFGQKLSETEKNELVAYLKSL